MAVNTGRDWTKYFGVVVVISSVIFTYGKLNSDIVKDKENTDLKLQYQSEDIKEIKGDIKDIKSMIFNLAKKK